MFGLFRRRAAEAPTFAVTFQPGNIAIQLKQGDNLLEAALQQGIAAPYNCRVGACKTCQIRVLEGQPKSLIEREYVFSQEEIAAHAYLACQTSVQSDMVVAWQAPAPHATASKVGARLAAIRTMTPRISRVQLRLDTPLSWRAGQFARLVPAGLGEFSRSYSMVSAGHDADLMSFDITHYPDGAVSPWLTDPANLGKALLVEAPCGEFGLAAAAPGAPPPLLCIAGGSGLGAIGGIVASHACQLREAGRAGPVLLVLGARDSSEVYGLAELREMAAGSGLPLRIEVVLDREPEGSAWQGRRGYVAEHLAQVLEEAAAADPRFRQPEQDWRVLLCGPSPLVDTAVAALRAHGMQAGQMTFDKYERHAA